MRVILMMLLSRATKPCERHLLLRVPVLIGIVSQLYLLVIEGFIDKSTFFLSSTSTNSTFFYLLEAFFAIGPNVVRNSVHEHSPS